MPLRPPISVWFFHLATFGALGCLLYDALYFGLGNHLLGFGGLLLIGILLLVLLVSIYLVAVTMFDVYYVSKTNRPAPYTHLWRHALVLPLGFGLTLLAIYFQIPLRVGFLLSRPQLERGVQDTLKSKDIASNRFGFYTAQSVRKVPQGVEFTMASDPIFRESDYAGFYYSTAPTPPKSTYRPESTTYTRLAPNWYLWEQTYRDDEGLGRNLGPEEPLQDE